jgi:hypothetical protein
VNWQKVTLKAGEKRLIKLKIRYSN